MYHGTSSEEALYACSKVASNRVWLFCDCAPAAGRGATRQAGARGACSAVLRCARATARAAPTADKSPVTGSSALAGARRPRRE